MKNITNTYPVAQAARLLDTLKVGIINGTFPYGMVFEGRGQQIFKIPHKKRQASKLPAS